MIRGRIEKKGKPLPQVADDFTRRIIAIIGRETTLWASWIKTEKLTGGTTDSKLAVRTGNLRASTKPMEVTQSGTTITGGVQFGSRYAATHIGPQGQVTTIRPKRRRFLTIPLDAAKTPAGVARGSALSGMWGETFFRRDGGNLILYGKKVVQRGSSAGGTRGRIVPLFLLVREVKIRVRVTQESMLYWIQPRIQREIAKAMAGG